MDHKKSCFLPNKVIIPLKDLFLKWRKKQKQMLVVFNWVLKSQIQNNPSNQCNHNKVYIIISHWELKIEKKLTGSVWDNTNA